MAVPTDKHIQIYAGDDIDISVLIKDGSGNPIDYAAYSDWRCQWRRTERDSSFIPSTIVQKGDYLVISFTKEQTREMGANGVIDLQCNDSGKIRTWFKAKADYVWDVTRND